ncbi:MAG: glycosyltransferase [Leptolyngbyaceae cyanobacterium]
MSSAALNSSTLVIIPALNEAATVGTVVQQLRDLGLSRIRVVDNGSHDRTREVARQAGAEVIEEPVKGYGQACWRGLQAVEPEVEWILFCDADGSDDLAQLPELLAQRADYDFILGNRRGTTTGRQQLTPVQNFGNWLASTLIYWGWGYQYHDLGPLRLIRWPALQAIQMRDRGFGWTVEMQARAVEQELQICEIPVNYRPRQGGQSKISGTLKGSFQAGMIILTTLAQLYGQTLMPQSFPMNSSPGKASLEADYPKRPWWGLESVILFLSACFLIWGTVWCLPHGDFLTEPTAVPQFWRGIAVMSVGFVLSWWVRALSAIWFWGVAIATRVLFLAMYPGDDIWRYLWEGLLQTQGFSPYDYAPNADILVPLRTAWWGHINHPDVSAIYPPVAQWGFRLLAAIAPSVLLFKLAFTAADLGICWLLSRRFGFGATLLYAWNPLVIYSFAGGGHYDSWFLLPLVAAWLWFERPHGRSLTPLPPLLHWVGSAVLLGFSIAVKWMSLPVLSFLAWHSLNRWRWQLTLFVILAGVSPFLISALPFCGLQACPLIPTSSTFVSHGRSAEFIPYFIAQIWAGSRQANWPFALPLGLWIAILLWRTQRLGSFTEGYLIGLLLLSPIVHGWYFTWLVPFAVASRNWGTRLVSLSAFVYFALPQRIALGDSSWLLTATERWSLWLPFILGLLWTSVSYHALRANSASPRFMETNENCS